MKNIRVMLVDDVPPVCQGLATMLRLATKNNNRKIEVVGEAQNGDEAIKQAQLLRPDVILIDLEMPILDGYKTTQFIKSQEPSVFIIILTIHGDSLARQRASQAGADFFIEKSAPLEELLQTILSFGTMREAV